MKSQGYNNRGCYGFYLQDNSPSQIETLISDIAEFTAAYPNTLDDELNTRWGDDFRQNCGERHLKIFA